MAVATFEEVNQWVSREATRRNGKIVPKLPKQLHDLCTEPFYFVFNVGPWEWPKQLGGRGTRTVPACPEGRKYSEPLALPQLDNETVAADMNKMENRQEDGIEVVNAVLVEGYGYRPEHSLRHWGVSVITHWPPTVDDLALANKELNAKFDELIAEADKHHEQHKYEDISEFHRLAARHRKLTKPWLNANPDLVPCGACGTDVKQNIARCPQCGAVLDEALDRKFFPEKYSRKAA